MALVVGIEPAEKTRHGTHSKTIAESSIATENGKRYLQIDTFGSEDRKFAGKVSQSMRFDEHSAGQLHKLIEQTFPKLRKNT